MAEAQMTTPEEWELVPTHMRTEVYAGLFASIELAAELGQPNPLTDEEMALLGYGLTVDGDAGARNLLTFDDGEMSHAIPMSDFFNLENVYRLLDATGDPRRNLPLEENPLRKWDVAKDEPLFVPIVVGALTMGAGGLGAAVAKGTASSAGTLFYQTASNSLKYLPSTIANLWRTYANPAAGSIIRGFGLRMAGTAGILGGAGLLGSAGDWLFNYDENIEATMDAQAVQMQSLATPEDVQQYQLARQAGINTPGEIMAEQVPLAQQSINWDPQPADYTQASVLSAEMWAAQNPIGGVEDAGPAYEDDPRIGVGQFYDPTPGRGETIQSTVLEQMRRPGVQRPGDLERFVRYHVSDYEEQIENMTPGQLVSFQQMAEQALLINTGGGEYGARAMPGQFDDATKQALMTVMAQANTEGVTWRDALESMVVSGQQWLRNKEASEVAPARTYTKPAYLAPDWSRLAVDARSYLEQRLGRKANDWEINLLGEEMKVLHRQQWDAEERAARATWDAEGRAMDTEEDTAAGTVQHVDAAARFEEFFTDKFANEIDRVDRVTQVNEATGRLMSGFDRAASVVGGR